MPEKNHLVERLKAAGISVEDAEYAASRHEQGNSVPLLRLLFLESAWAEVVDDHGDWIERWIRLGKSGFPFIDVAAVERLLASGVSREDLTAVVRSAQILAAYNFLNGIDDGWKVVERFVGAQPDGLGWRLVAHREAVDDEPERALGSLHADFADRDPSGRFGEPQ